jgi:hypothetical protein
MRTYAFTRQRNKLHSLHSITLNPAFHPSPPPEIWSPSATLQAESENNALTGFPVRAFSFAPGEATCPIHSPPKRKRPAAPKSTARTPRKAPAQNTSRQGRLAPQRTNERLPHRRHRHRPRARLGPALLRRCPRIAGDGRRVEAHSGPRQPRRSRHHRHPVTLPAEIPPPDPEMEAALHEARKTEDPDLPPAVADEVNVVVANHFCTDAKYLLRPNPSGRAWNAPAKSRTCWSAPTPSQKLNQNRKSVQIQRK